MDQTKNTKVSAPTLVARSVVMCIDGESMLGVQKVEVNIKRMGFTEQEILPINTHYPSCYFPLYAALAQQ